MAEQLGNEYKGASMSSGTLIPKDIFDKVKHLLPVEMRRKFAEAYLSGDNSVIEEILHENIFSYLNEISPDGYYFGSHEGDGSDFGFWECAED